MWHIRAHTELYQFKRIELFLPCRIDSGWTALLRRAHPLQRKMQHECQCQVCRCCGAARCGQMITTFNSFPDVKLFLGGWEGSRRSKAQSSKKKKKRSFRAHRWWCVFHYHHVFSVVFFFYDSYGSTHRHCGVSDRVARRLPYLRRAPRFQQVLGESPGRFGCHLLIWAVTEHDSTWLVCAAVRPGTLAPNMSRPSCVYAHARARTHTHKCTYAHTFLTHTTTHTHTDAPHTQQSAECWRWHGLNKKKRKKKKTHSTSGCDCQIKMYLANPSVIDSCQRVVHLLWRLKASMAAVVFFHLFCQLDVWKGGNFLCCNIILFSI